MIFTETLFKKTKEAHHLIATHPFISLLKSNKLASKMYMDLHKICIYEIQQNLKLNDPDLQKKLYRDIKQSEIYMSSSLEELLLLCKTHPLELEYLFIGGLIMGGNILKQYFSEDDYPFLTFENPRELFLDFKKYLNENVTNEDQFIEIVNKSYSLIKDYFDEIYNQFT